MKVLLPMILLGVVLITACSTPPAPVIERSSVPRGSVLENNGRYKIRSGDTLHAIAFRYGLDHRELASWNGIKSPYVIYPDQLLRLTRPARIVSNPKPSASSSTAGSSSSKSSTSKALPAKTAIKKPATPASPATRPVVPPPVKTGVSAGNPASGTVKPTQGKSPSSWVWPVNGRIIRGFLANDPARNGLDIGGREGQDIKASAGGTVVYSGNGLIGFGELIIIKHSEVMLSAYAHNRVRLVVEGVVVKQGQKIAELGRNDRNEPILHFEIRVSGRPVDPRKYLPKK